MTQAEYTKRWKERYKNEVENFIRRCNELNAELPTITRQATEEELKTSNKQKDRSQWFYSYILADIKEKKNKEERNGRNENIN